MIAVVNYHYIRESFKADYPSIFGQKPGEFEAQLMSLSKLGGFVSLEDIENDFERLSSSEKIFFLITFDDGLREQFELALPILDRLEVPAIFFVNTSNFEERKVSDVHKIHLVRSVVSPELIKSEIEKLIGGFDNKIDSGLVKNAYRFDEQHIAELKYVLNFILSEAQRHQMIEDFYHDNFDDEDVMNHLYMTPNQLKELADRGYLGSHSHRHMSLGQLKPDQIEQELSQSKHFLESLSSRSISSLSYPYGNPQSYNDQVVALAERIGYKFAFTTERGMIRSNHNKFTLKRYNCNDMPGGKNFKSWNYVKQA